jgi:serine acetyltransferase/GT2 family glycosyltransferase
VNTSIASVVIATHNRPESLKLLIGDLARQTVRRTDFEVIVVDDESPVPVPASIRGALLPGRFTLLRVPRGGPGAARNAGARAACGLVVIFVDDDMRLPPDFIEAHLAHFQPHFGPMVVLGNIQPDADIAAMPLFERYHARQLARFQDGAIRGSVRPRGVHLCTGNVSMRLVDFMDVGGFDTSLARSEDRELGIRLEQRGCRFSFGQHAISMHGSDHRDPAVWRGRNELYGRADLIIARKHPGRPGVHPWRFWSLIPSFGRPLALATLLAPRLGQALATTVFGIARVLDALGASRVAVALTGLTYCLDYFRGLRREAGSWRAARPTAPVPAVAPTPVPALVQAPPQTPGPAPVVRRLVADPPRRFRAWHDFRSALAADYDTMRAHRQKYHADSAPAGGLASSLVRKVGLQLLAAYRLMRFLDATRIPVLPQVMSRLIRHLYGAELHWKSRIAPGISVVHGVGLVLSHAADVGPGCILFQGVTLGESVHPVTGMIGAPRLEANVHVGPGATLLGPIVIGAGTKVMAGAVVTRDIPPNSLVSAPAPQVSARVPRNAAFRASRAM